VAAYFGRVLKGPWCRSWCQFLLLPLPRIFCFHWEWDSKPCFKTANNEKQRKFSEAGARSEEG